MSFDEEALVAKFLTPAPKLGGKAVVAHISALLDHPKVLVFGEFLAMPNFQALRGTEDAPHLQLLELFAYGTYEEYKGAAAALPELSHAALKKLKQLSIVSLAADSKLLGYPLLQAKLEIGSVRELEDLVIDAFYSGLLRGRLDQREAGQLEVLANNGRDVRPGTGTGTEVAAMIAKLAAWEAQATTVLGALEKQERGAKAQRASAAAAAEAHATKVEEAAKALKARSEREQSQGGMEFSEDPSSHSMRAMRS